MHLNIFSPNVFQGGEWKDFYASQYTLILIPHATVGTCDFSNNNSEWHEIFSLPSRLLTVIRLLYQKIDISIRL